MKSARWCARAVIAALALGLLAASVHAEDYPRLGLLGSMTGDGYPLWDVNGTLQDTTLDALARYHEVILDASPITPYRPDAIAALRTRRPDIKLFAYVTGSTIWDASAPDSTVNFPTRYKRLVRDLNGYLYNTAGGYFSLARVNLAKRDAGGNFVVAEGIADLFYDAIAKTGFWDGIYIDTYCKSILWMDSPSEHIDYVRAGYASLTAFDAAWGAGIDTLGNRLRRLAGANFEMVGNCASSTNYATFNGWMRENFPFQNGGDWYHNMFNEVGGYLGDDVKFRAPHSNYLYTAGGGTNPYLSTYTRKARFGLGSAALASGYSSIGSANRSPTPYPYFMWWYDEYAVDLATGNASPNLQHTGWLGQPLGPYYQMIWITGALDAVSNSNFETDVTTGWTYGLAEPGATRTQDLSTAGKGSASLKLHVPTTGITPWDVSAQSVGTIPMVAGVLYSATFWAKASSEPRHIAVVAGWPTGGGSLTSTTLDLGTTWKQYQVALVPPVSGSALLQLFVAYAPGDVWFDDVHLQQGASSIYRRDFQNGSVLVNPSATSLSLPLERTFRKIHGTRDPVTNDGTSVTQVTLPASDALFLIGDDRIPPAAVTGLQPGPAWKPSATRAVRPRATSLRPRKP